MQMEFKLRDREGELRVKSSTYYQELGKMVMNITLEDDTNIKSIHREIENTEYEVEDDGDESAEGGEAA